MFTKQEKAFGFWFLQLPGWILLIYLIFAQGIAAFSYDLGVAMGTQESVEKVTEIGTAYWYGFAFGDLLTYIPLLLLGLIGHLRERYWGGLLLAAALGISVYWPVVSLAALVKARNAAGWNIENEAPYWIVCLAVAAWSAWGLVFLVLRGSPGSSGQGR